jgi:hypothetical protein
VGAGADMETIEKTRRRLGVRAKLTRWRPLGALVAATVVVLSYFFLLLFLFKFMLADWISEEMFFLLFIAVINPISFLALFLLFLWKQAWANAVVDRSIYLYRLAVYPYNILYFRAFKSETGMERKLRATAGKRRRVERKQALRRHREMLEDEKEPLP